MNESLPSTHLTAPPRGLRSPTAPRGAPARSALAVLSVLALLLAPRRGLPQAPGTEGAPAPHEWTLAPGSRLWLEGESTLHRYRAEAKGVFLTARIPAVGPTGSAADALLQAASGAARGEVRLPVRSLTSGEGALDRNMWSALKADRNPVILFRMSSLHRVAGGAPGALAAEGTLSVAGVSRPAVVQLLAAASRDAIQLTGAQELKMSDFDVKAPVLFAGALKTSDTVTVRFDLRLHRAPP